MFEREPFNIMEGNQKENTLGEWSDGDDDWIMEIAEPFNIIEGNQKENTLGEWSDSDYDEIIRNVEENVQTGRGRKRKSDETDEGSSASLPEENFYVIESVKEVKSKKFRMTGTDYTIRFNNTASQLDLIESYERTQEIFERLLNDVTAGMNEKDQVRFVLRSDQLNTPISIPFMPLQQLTPEHVFSQFERVIQSNQDFQLNDTVTVDIVHIQAPQGSGRKKRTLLDIGEFLHKKKTVITIRNDDELCLARALVIAIAKIEKDPSYRRYLDPRERVQERKARELHEAANVPLGPCGIAEVEVFQNHLANYEINSFCRTR